MLVNAAQIAEFHTKGFTVVPGVYRADEIKRVSDWLDELCDSDGHDNEIATYYEASPSTGETVLVRAEYLLGEHNPAMTELLLKPDVKAALRRLTR